MDDFGVVHALPDHAVWTFNIDISYLACITYHEFMADIGLASN